MAELTMTAPSGTPVNHAALAGVRFLVTHRVEELENTVAAMDAEITRLRTRSEQSAGRLSELEERWNQALRNLPDVDPSQLDELFRALAAARADLAATEERCADLTQESLAVRTEQEVLRSVHRSLDDLAAAGAGREEGVAKLRTASRQVFQIIEEERMRIARDMHDGPAQSMANLVLQAEILERLIARDPQLVVTELRDFKNGVRAVLDDTRRLIFDLRPMTLDDLGLVPTLRKFVGEFSQRSGINAALRVVGEESRLAGTLEPTLFRIVQEAMNNARKHASAKNIEVLITFQPSYVTAAVRDDGVGMDVAATEARIDGTRNLGL